MHDESLRVFLGKTANFVLKSHREAIALPLRKPVIIDCDPGLDDAIALMIAFVWEDKLDVKAVTCAAGNQTIEKTFRNALRIAKHLNVTVPVARGADSPLIKPLFIADNAHGESGLEGMDITDETIEPSELRAIDLMSKVLRESKEKITILATAPLTNVALLLKAHPELKEKIDHITLMGGSSLVGNMSPVSEFNIFVDPDAAKIVFDSGVPIVMFSLDVTYKAYTTSEDIRRASVLNNKASRMFADLLNFYAAYSKSMGLTGVAIHDACTVIYELKPELFSGIKHVNVDIDTSSGLCNGCTLVDLYRLTEKTPNVDFVTEVDRAAFNAFIFDTCAKYVEKK